MPHRLLLLFAVLLMSCSSETSGVDEADSAGAAGNVQVVEHNNDEPAPTNDDSSAETGAANDSADLPEIEFTLRGSADGANALVVRAQSSECITISVSIGRRTSESDGSCDNVPWVRFDGLAPDTSYSASVTARSEGFADTTRMKQYHTGFGADISSQEVTIESIDGLIDRVCGADEAAFQASASFVGSDEGLSWIWDTGTLHVDTWSDKEPMIWPNNVPGEYQIGVKLERDGELVTRRSETITILDDGNGCEGVRD